jgi:hypothetical protein
MANFCDRCGSRICTTVTPIQLSDGEVSYVDLCDTCLSVAFKLVFEGLLLAEETLSELYQCNLSRKDILNNILNKLRNRV